MKNVEQKGCKIENTPLENVYWAARQAKTQAEHEGWLAELELSTPGTWTRIYSGCLSFSFTLTDELANIINLTFTLAAFIAGRFV